MTVVDGAGAAPADSASSAGFPGGFGIPPYGQYRPVRREPCWTAQTWLVCVRKRGPGQQAWGRPHVKTPRWSAGRRGVSAQRDATRRAFKWRKLRPLVCARRGLVGCAFRRSAPLACCEGKERMTAPPAPQRTGPAERWLFLTPKGRRRCDTIFILLSSPDLFRRSRSGTHCLPKRDARDKRGHDSKSVITRQEKPWAEKSRNRMTGGRHARRHRLR